MEIEDSSDDDPEAVNDDDDEEENDDDDVENDEEEEEEEEGFEDVHPSEYGCAEKSFLYCQLENANDSLVELKIYIDAGNANPEDDNSDDQSQFCFISLIFNSSCRVLHHSLTHSVHPFIVFQIYFLFRLPIICLHPNHPFIRTLIRWMESSHGLLFDRSSARAVRCFQQSCGDES